MSTRRKPQSRNPAGGASRSQGGSGARSSAPSTDAPQDGSASVGAAKGAAVGLWVLVGGGLVYGVSQTLVKVVALFTS